MKFSPLPLQGACIIEPERIEDERGFFARTFCRKEFARHGLNYDLVQCGASFNKRKGTLRGMHYQRKPHEEAKLVRCTMGKIYDVIIDLNSESRSFMRWTSVELSAKNRKMVYIPEGFAHGFLTLTDNSEVFYQVSEYYHPDLSAGFRWDDSAFAIEWPEEIRVIAERDKIYADFLP